jgi:hypothetical protein
MHSNYFLSFLESLSTKLHNQSDIQLINIVKDGFVAITESDIALIPGGDLPITNPKVFNIPIEIALDMLGYDRLGEDADLTNQDWITLYDDLIKSGLKNAMAIGTINNMCHMVSGNHRIHILNALGCKSIPVFFSNKQCSHPYKELPIDSISKYSNNH